MQGNEPKFRIVLSRQKTGELLWKATLQCEGSADGRSTMGYTDGEAIASLIVLAGRQMGIELKWERE